jgi:ComF family protein
MLRWFMHGLADIIFPRTCLACKDKLGAISVHNLICSQCWSKVRINLPPFCHCCGRHLDKNNLTKNTCPRCLKTRLHFDRAFSPCVYTGVIKELIHSFKYNNKDYLGLTLSGLMIDFIREYNLPIDCLDLIIPIPLSKARLREREFNQARILGSHIGREFNKDVSNDALIRLRHTRTQTELDLDKRASNVKGSFSLTPKADIKGKKILLIDDVLTSGATSSEAAYVLKDAGAAIVFVLTLAN